MLRVLAAVALLTAAPTATAGDISMRTQGRSRQLSTLSRFHPKGGTGITVAIIGKGTKPVVATTLRMRLKMYDVSKTEADVYDDAEISAESYDEAALVGSLAPGAHLISIKAADKAGSCTPKEIETGVTLARKLHPQILPIDLGGDVVNAPLVAAVEAAEHDGILVLAAVGNEIHLQNWYFQRMWPAS